ncbi:MAG: molybdopterin molybdotransferase MoeA [Terracidiphilus sp.]|jgi:molybdopterin molybdotransferase
MISLVEARALIWNRTPLLSPHPAPLAEVSGRILRNDIHAPDDLPAFDRAAMDGYAIRCDDSSPRFRLAGEIQPGITPSFKIEDGECARIFTGARLPEGASEVLMQEDAKVEDNFVIPLQRTSIPHIRYKGEDARSGDLLLAAGTRLGQGELALLAGIGIMEPLVSPQIRVAHFVTGNEVVAPTQTPLPGQIRDSNSTLVAAFIRQNGGRIVRQERLPDDFNLLLNQARSCDDDYDLLIVSGGASVGDYDFGKRLLCALGFEIYFERVDLRPGKPLIFGTRGTHAAFVVPGNPISHFVTLNVEVKLALEKLSGASASWPAVKVRLKEDFNYRSSTRDTFYPAHLIAEDSELVVRALRWKSSGDVTGLAGANALLHMTDEMESPKAGDSILTLLVGGL